MNLFSHPDFDNHKLVTFFHEKEAGLKGVIGIHNDDLGSAMGGSRMRDDFLNDYYICQLFTRLYSREPSGKNDDQFNEFGALTEALRLSKSMTYKAALAGVDQGGGKAVIIGDPATQKTKPLLHAYGRRLNYLNGGFIASVDSGFKTADIEEVAKVTPYIAGRSEGQHDGVKGSGDPGPVTAFGIMQGIKAVLEFLFGTPEIRGRNFAIPGLGSVGFRLARYLYEQGGNLILADVNPHMVERALREFEGARAVNAEEIWSQKVDIICPCLTNGGIINDWTLGVLQCKGIAGGTNNQLAEKRHGDELHRRKIPYATDYAINAGGLINVCGERETGGYDRERTMRKVSKIYQTIKTILNLSAETDTPTYLVADKLAEEILSAASQLKQMKRKIHG